MKGICAVPAPTRYLQSTVSKSLLSKPPYMYFRLPAGQITTTQSRAYLSDIQTNAMQ